MPLFSWSEGGKVVIDNKAGSMFMKRFLLPVLAGLVSLTLWAGESVVVEDDIWKTYMEALEPLGEFMQGIVGSEDPLLRQEANQMVMSAISQSYLGLFSGDADYPDFWPMANQLYNFGAGNPDNAYYTAPLDGKGTYKFSGYRGTVRNVDFQIGGGRFYTRGEMPLAKTYANYDIDSLKIGEDGYFEVILSAQRPKGYTGNWWKLHPEATYVWLRQTSYDWVHEEDGRFAIDRLDVAAAKPRLSAKQISANLEQAAVWAKNWSQLGPRWLNRLKKEGYVNKIKVHDLADVGGFTEKQQYLEGIFQLEPGEALIYETEVPEECRYWNVQLTDMLWRSHDWMHRQTSINGHTAHIDADGKFRAVIAHTDPGVPNWLDTLDYREGEIIGRWKQCSSYPEPSLKKVQLTDIRNYLPKDTPTVSSEEREADLRVRRQGAQMRRRW
jgi:hypothetical protein